MKHISLLLFLFILLLSAACKTAPVKESSPGTISYIDDIMSGEVLDSADNHTTIKVLKSALKAAKTELLNTREALNTSIDDYKTRLQTAQNQRDKALRTNIVLSRWATAGKVFLAVFVTIIISIAVYLKIK